MFKLNWHAITGAVVSVAAWSLQNINVSALPHNWYPWVGAIGAIYAAFSGKAVTTNDSASH